jgi:nucleotide-binding universal stress UspA family protein
MFRNVIAGVDQHDGGRDAIALAMQLLGRGGHLTFAYVYAGEPAVYRGVSAAYETSTRRHDLELLRAVRAEAGVPAELRWERAPSVGRGLHELCEAAHADLLVVGASRRRGMLRAVRGDDTREALSGAPCAVAIAPADYRRSPSEFREIGVGYDGSANSTHALRVARQLAAVYGSRLSVFEGIDVSLHLVNAAVADDMVQTARARLALLGGVKAHAACGRPADELTLYSRVVDLLVIGPPGRIRPGRPGRSGVARELARSARCPLLSVASARDRSREVRDDRSPRERRRSMHDVSHPPDHSEARQ